MTSANTNISISTYVLMDTSIFNTIITAVFHWQQLGCPVDTDCPENVMTSANTRNI